MIQTLNLHERILVQALNFRGRETLRDLRAVTGLREHAIQYALAKLQERKMVWFGPVINFYALGFTEYEFFFSLLPDKRNKREAVLARLNNAGAVVFTAELGGESQFMAVLIARSLHKVAAFIDGLEEQFGSIFYDKRVTTILSYTMYSRKYLSEKNIPTSVVECREPLSILQTDNLDLAILNTLWRTGARSNRDLARHLGAARATVDYRVRRLEEGGVIVGYGYFPDPIKLGISHFRICLETRVAKKALTKDLAKFCERHPFVIYRYECLGHSDYELGLDALDASSVAAFIQHLYLEFGDRLQNIRIEPLLNTWPSRRLLDPKSGDLL